MTKIVYEMSDIIIPTADNSRSEDIEKIFEDMKKAYLMKLRKNFILLLIEVRLLKKACELAKPGDYILLAGKGHEKYQEIKGVKFYFNDMEELKNFKIVLNSFKRS